MSSSSSSALFPLFLKLAGRKAVVVGGGHIAASKVAALIEAGAVVTVVAPSVHPEIENVPVRVLRRPFEEADLDGAWLVVAAGPPEVNREVQLAAEERRVFVTAVDDPARCSAYAGGVLRRGGVTVAVSTDGLAPALAGLLREGLEAVLPEDLAAWVQAARDERQRWRQEGIAMDKRRPLLLEALNRLYEGRRETVGVGK